MTSSEQAILLAIIQNEKYRNYKGTTMQSIRVSALAFFFSVIWGILFLAPSSATADPQKEQEAHLAASAKEDLVAIKRDTTLQEDDQINFLVGLKETCHVYVIYRDIQDEITVMFSENLEKPDSKKKITAWTYHRIGPFILDDQIGTTRVHLIASHEPLLDLEKHLTAYDAAKPAQKTEASKAVVNEISSLRRAHRKLAKPAERPANLAGVFRGDQKDHKPNLADLAVEISATGFYAKTFTIEQQQKTQPQ
jgi:hypothetical protein